MIPANLQTGLTNRLREIFSDFRLKNPNGEETNLNIYEQNLPQLDADNDISFYPYIVVKLADGEVIDETSLHKIKVLFIVGVFDDALDNQGDKDIVSIIQKMMEGLQKNPIIEKKFTLSYPLRWTIHEEDVYPFYFGGVETYWETNPIQREDIGGIIYDGFI